MADLADVSNALKGIVAAAIYPLGTDHASAILQDGDPVDCAVVRGWPVKQQLAQNMSQQIVTVSIYPIPGMERNVSRFPRQWQTKTDAAPTITASIAGQVIRLAGTVTTPENVAIKTGGNTYTYAVQPGDTLSSIATALASLVNADAPATSAGPMITIPAGSHLGVAIGGQGLIWRELRRQVRLFQVTAWCTSPEQRDPTAAFVDGVLAGAGQPNGREFIALADGSEGRLLYVRTIEADKDELVGSYRRDFVYSVEYPTIEIQAATQIVTIGVGITQGPEVVSPPTNTINI